MSLNDRAADRKAHAHTGSFCGDERLKYPMFALDWQPDATIRHSNLHLPGSVRAQPDDELALSIRDRLHGFYAVEEQVE
ncbi:MAG TPA: hypothetical protein VKT80_18120 [Chloroflexota bacterium]|nr:hypothetical protein [Chloroflexota bacterium]